LSIKRCRIFLITASAVAQTKARAMTMDKRDFKTAMLAIVAAAAFIAAAIVSVAPAASQPVYRGGEVGVHRVSAAGISQTRGPVDYNEWRARRLAIEHWRQKVIGRYGIEYAHWFSARGPQVQCDGRYGLVRCEASALPARRGVAGGPRWGWNRI
jgi:hypothetical protein